MDCLNDQKKWIKLFSFCIFHFLNILPFSLDYEFTFYFLVTSIPDMGLELMRLRVICSSHWASQASTFFFIFKWERTVFKAFSSSEAQIRRPKTAPTHHCQNSSMKRQTSEYCRNKYHLLHSYVLHPRCLSLTLKQAWPTTHQISKGQIDIFPSFFPLSSLPTHFS